MDIESQQLAAVHSMGVCGIYGVSLSLIYQLKKPMSLIFVTLLLPLSFTTVAPEYLVVPILSHGKTTSTSDSFLVWVVTVLSGLPFASMSTAAIAHAISRLNTPPGEPPSFRMSMSVVPRVWKRVALTVACSYVSSYMLNLFLPTTSDDFNTITRSQASIFIMYGVVYMWASIVWQMAAVISVMDEEDDAKGLRAALKSATYLIRRRKVLVGVMLTFNYLLAQLGVSLFLWGYKLDDRKRSWEEVLTLGLCILLWALFNLIQLVVQTVLYTVCKPTQEEAQQNTNIIAANNNFLQKIYLLVVGAGIATCFTS